MKKFISYRRVSTQKQGASGLGLEAQQEVIDYFVKREQGEVIKDFVEVHSGKDLNECVVLREAMQEAKKSGAVLVVAKSDRFRNVSQALEVLDEMGEGKVMFCDLPHSDRFTLTLFFALAERERLITSIRTKQALKAKKERGERLGSPLFIGKDKETEATRAIRKKAIGNAAAARRATADADENNRKAWATIEARKDESLRQLADYLNEYGFKTSTGGKFTHMAVKRLRERYAGKGGKSWQA
ncbi:MAG: recombinase family protein [Prevotella sp.]|nr:recombinase family protein [Prevotella sp.]